MGRYIWSNGEVTWVEVRRGSDANYNKYNTYITQKQMSYERGAIMLAHSAMIGIAIYLMMRYVFNQSSFVAEDRSIVIAAFVLIYMIMFGHGLPGQINKNLSFLS